MFLGVLIKCFNEAGRPGGRFLAAVLCYLMVVVAAHAQQPEQTEVLGAKRVTAEELVEVFWLQRGKLILIDSRMVSDRYHGYIEGSVSLPSHKANCASLARLIPGLDTPVAFYCNNPKCGRSAKSVQIARGCGYRNLYWLRGGIEEWISKDFPYLRH